MARTGLAVGELVVPWPTTSPRTPFFWLVNSKAQNVAAARSAGGAVCQLREREPIQMRVSVARNGVDSARRGAVYSPGRIRKKKPSHIISAVAAIFGEASCMARW